MSVTPRNCDRKALTFALNDSAAATRKAEIVEVGISNWTVVDSAIDFDLQAQIVEEPVIIFTSGDCAGAEFVIVKYDHPTKTITFKESVDDSGARRAS